MWARRPTKGWVLRQLEGIETVQATAIIKIGERLAEARDLFRYDRREGGFEGWCQSRLNISRSTAYNMIRVFEQLGESVQGLAHFDQITREALYALAAPSTSEEVRDAVEQMLIDGEKVTAANPKTARCCHTAALGRRSGEAGGTVCSRGKGLCRRDGAGRARSGGLLLGVLPAAGRRSHRHHRSRGHLAPAVVTLW